MDGIEKKYINAMNRYCGFKILGQVASCYMNDQTMTSCFNWFCSSLRNNKNVLAHYSDGLVGMGEYLLDKCRTSFFEIYCGIVKQLKSTSSKESIEFLLNCTQWRIGATDHQYILKSGIIETLKEGNGDSRKEKNPIKYCWGHKLDFKNYSGSETLSHIILETLEFIMMACFSRVLGQDEDKDLSMKKTGSNIAKIQQAYSVVNTNITEVLMATSFEIIFIQLSRYSKFIENFDPIDWQLFVKTRNQMRASGENLNVQDDIVFEDEKTVEEISKERDDEAKEIEEEDKRLEEEAKQEGAAPRNKAREILDRKTKKELEKVSTLYDEKVILKLLRLLEVFTSIALKDSKIHSFVVQVTRPTQILSLISLLLNCQSKHGLITLKIINNLLKVGIDKGTIDEALNEYKNTDSGKKLFAIKTKAQFEDSAFLQFFYNLLYTIRISQWEKRSYESYGSYNISCGIAKLIKSIIRSNSKTTWKDKIEAVMDDFLENIDSYSIEEFDVMISLFEGGEYEGLNTGSFGKTKTGGKFTTVGFVKKWYDLSLPDNQQSSSDFQIEEISSDLTDKELYLLAIHFDDKHPERNDMFLSIPDEVTLISSLESFRHDYLLDKERLNKFLRAMEIEKMPEKNDPVSLTKRCVGMKILVEHIMIYGDKIADLFDEQYRNEFINFLLKECAAAEQKKENLKCEWYEQRLYAIKKHATESQNGLKHGDEKSIIFNDKNMSISCKATDSNETYFKLYSLQSAMNYGQITQNMSFKIVSSDTIQQTPYKNDNIVLMKSDNIDTPEKLAEIYNHVDVIITSDLDLKEMHDKLVALNNTNVAYFKSLILLTSSDFQDAQEIVANGAKTKRVSNDDMSEHQAFCEELKTFCNFEQEQLNTIFKDKEDSAMTDKIKLLMEWNNKKDKDEDKKKDEEDKKEDEKQEDNKEDQKQDDYDENAYETWFGLERSEHLGTGLSDLANYANNNYSNNTTTSVKKGELYSKVYEIKGNDLIGEYVITLASLYKQLSRKTLSSFFSQLSLEKLLEIILENEENFELLMKYIQIRGNEAVNDKNQSGNSEGYDNFLNLIKKIIEVGAKESKFNKLIDIIFKKVIITGSSKILGEAMKEKKKNIAGVFKDETSAVKALNLFLVPEVIKFLLKSCPKSIYGSENDLMNLLAILLMIPLTFRDEKDFNKSIYMAIYKLISPIANNSEQFPESLKIKLLTFSILKQSFDKVNYEVKISDSNCLTNEQKILFEIYLTIRQIDDSLPDFSSIYTYPDKVLEIERCKVILKEMKKFDMVSYLTYYDKELTDDEKSTKIYEETLHNRYKGKTTARYEYEGFKKMSVKIHEDTALEGTSSIGFTTDKEGVNVIKKISYIDIEKNNTTFSINASKFYAHYPYNPPKIMSWGYGYDYRLGNNESGNTTSSPVEVNNYTKPIKKLFGRSGFIVGLGEDGKVYWCGYRSDWGGYKYTWDKYEHTMPEEKVIDMRCGSYNCALLTESHQIWIQGYCTGYHLDNGSTKSYFWHKVRPDEETEKIIAWDVGYNYHVYVTNNGKAYGAGNDFMRGIDLECTGKDYVQIPFDEGVVPKKPVCVNNSETYKPLFMFVEVEGKTELWSAGYSGYGLLGQGGDKRENRKFEKLDYNQEEINFVQAKMKYYHAMALTDDGRLFSWGSNGSYQCGLNESKTYYTPTEIPFFKDYLVRDFELGDYHSMVCASPRNELDKKMIFMIGDIRGISDTSGKNSEGILHYKPFDDIEYSWMECGENTFYLGFEGENRAGINVGVHEGYTCEVTNQTPIEGTMHFWQSDDKNWHFVSQEGYTKLKEEGKEIPDICYATKYPITDIQGKEWPEFKSSEVLQEEADETYPKYFAFNSQGETRLTPTKSTDEEGIFNYKSFDSNPLIFYRLTRPLKADASLPSLNLTNYHEETDKYGYKIEITPDYTYEKNDTIIKLQKDKYNKVVKGMMKFNEKYDNELLECIEKYITENSVDFINYPNSEIDASNLTFTSRELKAMNSKDIQPRINAFLEFNKNFLLTIPFVILEEEMIKEVTGGKSEVKGETLSILFMISKSIAFRAIKNSYIKKIADSLPTNYDEPEVHINRMLIRHKRDKGKVDDKGEWSIFSTVMKKMKEKNYEYLRVCNSSYKAWKTYFLGEGSVDAGGPFRESVENITDEVQSYSLPLLIPTQNHKNDHGFGRDCWTVNPSSTSPHHLEMYKFFGAMIGMAFRSGHVMDLRFPSLFWKKFIGDPVTIDDLAGSDAYAVQAIKDLEKNKGQIPPDMFVDMMDLSYTTQLSNGETVPIIEDGENKKVTFDEVDEYHKLVIKARAEEGMKQIKALREGFEIIFPMSILGILSWRDVEERVRGPSEISVAALKSITEYSSCSSDNEFVQRFWRVLEEFTNEEKSKFLKFVWGRSRLPISERIRDQNFKLYLMDSGRFTEHDTHFPESHTCFFQLDLPRYTTDEACKSKILYAIATCGEIDTDNSSYSIADAGGNWDDSD